jgi:hypothetical protein
VAEFLTTSASVPTVHLMADLFYRSIRTGFILPFVPEAQQQNEVVIEAITGTVATFARGGYDVVVDGIIGDLFRGPEPRTAPAQHSSTRRPDRRDQGPGHQQAAEAPRPAPPGHHPDHLSEAAMHLPN